MIRARTSTAPTTGGTLRSCWPPPAERGKPWACSCQKVNSGAQPRAVVLKRLPSLRGGGARTHVVVLFRGERQCERHVRLQLPSLGHPAAQRPEKHPRGSVAGALELRIIQFSLLTCY